MRVLRFASFAAFALLLAGCGAARKSTAPELTPLNGQQAQIVAQQVALSMVTVSDVPVTFGSMQPWARSARPPKFSVQPTSLDTTIVEGDDIWQFSAHLYDEAGNEQADYDDATTYRLTASSWVHGTWSDENAEATIGSRGLLDMRGLGAPWSEVTTNGSRSDSLECSFASDTSSTHYRSICTGTLNNVVRAKPFAQNPYPTSGTVRWAVAADLYATQGSGSAEAHWNASVVVTFDGSRYAQVLVNSTHRFTLDLETGEVTPLAA